MPPESHMELVISDLNLHILPMLAASHTLSFPQFNAELNISVQKHLKASPKKQAFIVAFSDENDC